MEKTIKLKPEEIEEIQKGVKIGTTVIDLDDTALDDIELTSYIIL